MRMSTLMQQLAHAMWAEKWQELLKQHEEMIANKRAKQ